MGQTATQARQPTQRPLYMNDDYPRLGHREGLGGALLHAFSAFLVAGQQVERAGVPSTADLDAGTSPDCLP